LASSVFAMFQPRGPNMKLLHSFLVTLAAGATLVDAPAFAQGARTGPGAMRCTVVIGRLSSQDSADRMPVLSWVQGYLAGVAAARSLQDTAPAVEVPEYDALKPRILTLCKADPRSDLHHVADRFLSVAYNDR
jgi:hypothetical protein